jgi:ankyrin repeat protein
MTEQAAPSVEEASLCLAVRDEDKETVKKLLASGVDPNTLYGGQTPVLCLATDIGNIEIMEMLIHAKADVNEGDCDKVTPLMRAASKDFEEGVKLLLGVEGVNVKLEDITKETALTLAILEEHRRIVELLRGSE